MHPNDIVLFEPWLGLLILLAASATAVFVQIQSWLNDPNRHAFNEAWFQRFEEHLRARYREERELNWRVRALSGHFSDWRH
jgi:hypothetical protein